MGDSEFAFKDDLQSVRDVVYEPAFREGGERAGTRLRRFACMRDAALVLNDSARYQSRARTNLFFI